MSRLKTELQFLRKRSALKVNDDSRTGQVDASGHVVAERDNSRSCARCRIGLGRIINRGALCKSCRQRVCKACREYNLRGTDWVCTICYKNASVEIASEEWMNPLIRRPSRRRHSKDGVAGGDIVARGIRRSWTISNPSSSKEEPLSPELRVYNTLVTPVRKADESNERRIPISTDENQPPPPLLWEPRDPPLQYSGVLHYDNQPKSERPHRRVGPRRSASLSQADNVFFEGKMIPRLQSQSPPRPVKVYPPHGPEGDYNAAARYEDYYETKYEKPIRREYHPPQPNVKTEDSAKIIQPLKYEGFRSDKSAWRSQSDDRLRTASKIPAATKTTAAVDVDAAAALKSRWRSASPPPPLAEDWVPIKPPQLAWAKAVPVETVERLEERRRVPRSKDETPTSRRSKIPVMQMPTIPRSVSGDMIYLERESSDVLRERTLSIDRGIGGSASKGQGDRMLYKTYEEELRDYQGRTGSVDRLANRGRPRTAIRMGTLSHAGKSVPSSLERRHSEVGSRERRRDSRDDSASSARGNRRGSGSDSMDRQLSSADPAEYSRLKYRPEQQPHPPGGAAKTRNVNRVYIDGSSGPDPPVQLINRTNQPSNATASQIRVTMTDTRSLKRPPKSGATAVQPESTKFRPIETVQATTLPRMNKRTSGNPGPTTVYLGDTSDPVAVQAEASANHPPANDAESPPSAAGFRHKATPKRLKTDVQPSGMNSFDSGSKNAHWSPAAPLAANRSTRSGETRKSAVSSSARDSNHSLQVQSESYADRYEQLSEDSASEVTSPMQDASVQTSDLLSDEYRSDFLDTTNEEMGSAGRLDRSGSQLEDRRSCGIQSEVSGLPYHNQSDTASDIVLDTNKILPEGDDYKIVFISSDSSKSSLEGSFDTSDQSPLHSRHPSSVNESETAGFIDESDWDFFSSHGRSSAQGRRKHPPPSKQQQQPAGQRMQRGQVTSHSSQTTSRNSSSDESRIHRDASAATRTRKVKKQSDVLSGTDTSRERTSTLGSVASLDDDNPRTFMIDDYNYGWAEQTTPTAESAGQRRAEAHNAEPSPERELHIAVRSASGSSAASMEDLNRHVTYTTRQVQTDYCSVDGDFIDLARERNDYSPTRSIEEWETMSHIRTNPGTPRAPFRTSGSQADPQHFVPIWQVPSSSRSSTHSLQSLLVNTSQTEAPESARDNRYQRSASVERTAAVANIQDDSGGRREADYDPSSRPEYEIALADRTFHQLNNIDQHILSQSNLLPEGINGPGPFISSLYSPEGLALPGFQEYRQQILTEIQAYTAKGDWNLVATSDVSCMHVATTTSSVAEHSPHFAELINDSGENANAVPDFHGDHNSSWSAVVELARKNAAAISRPKWGNYRVRSTGSRQIVPPSTKRWRAHDAETLVAENTTRSAAAVSDGGDNNQTEQHFHWAEPGDSVHQPVPVSAISQAGGGQGAASSVETSNSETIAAESCRSELSGGQIRVKTANVGGSRVVPVSEQVAHQPQRKAAESQAAVKQVQSLRPSGGLVPPSPSAKTSPERDSTRDSQSSRSHQIGTKAALVGNNPNSSKSPKRDQSHNNSNNLPTSRGPHNSTGSPAPALGSFSKNPTSDWTGQLSGKQGQPQGQSGIDQKASGNCTDSGQTIRPPSDAPSSSSSLAIERVSPWKLKAQHQLQTKAESGRNDKLPLVSSPAAASSLGSPTSGQSSLAALSHSTTLGPSSTPLAVWRQRHSSAADSPPDKSEITSQQQQQQSVDITARHLQLYLALSREATPSVCMEQVDDTCNVQTPHVAPSCHQQDAAQVDGDRNVGMAEPSANSRRLNPAAGLASGYRNAQGPHMEPATHKQNKSRTTQKFTAHDADNEANPQRQPQSGSQSVADSVDQANGSSPASHEAKQPVSRDSHASSWPQNKTMDPPTSSSAGPGGPDQVPPAEEAVTCLNPSESGSAAGHQRASTVDQQSDPQQVAPEEHPSELPWQQPSAVRPPSHLMDQNEQQGLTLQREMTANGTGAPPLSRAPVSPAEVCSLPADAQSTGLDSEADATRQSHAQSRFEVTPAETSDVRAQQSLHQRRLLSDSDVPTSGDEADSAVSFDTDSQHETVIEGHSSSYQDLRQFALKQSLLRKDSSLSPTPTALSIGSDANEQSDTDSSSSRTEGSHRRTGSFPASPVPSDGRLTPRRAQGQYTSYVLITQESAKIPTPPNDQVISDDESGVTVTVPQPAASEKSKVAAVPPAVCVVEVPARESPPWPTDSPRDPPEETNQSDSEAADTSETNEEVSGSCVTVSGNGVLTDHDIEEDTATDNDYDDENTPTDQVESSSKLANYFTYALESTEYSSRRKQPVVYRNTERTRSSSPDPFTDDAEAAAEIDAEAAVRSEELEDASFASNDEPTADVSSLDVTEQDTIHYESDPSDRLDSINDDESNYSESVSSGDEAYFDREEELRGYNRAIDFTLHTILEESCEESDGERRSRTEHRSVVKSSEPSELEKYFTFGLGGGSAVAGDGPDSGKRRTSFANEESEYSDTFSETSSSIYSEGLESVERSAGEEDDIDPVELASSRLEKYFMTNFLGLEAGGQYAFPVGGRPDQSHGSDGSESVGSDSEGHPSPEQRRRKVMVKTRQGRGQRQQNSAASDSWSHSRSSERKESIGSDVSATSASELNNESNLELGEGVDAAPGDRHRSNSSTSDDGSDLLSSEEEEIAFEKSDGQFDTIKRRKKKRSAADHEHDRVERQDKLAHMEDKLAAGSTHSSTCVVNETLPVAVVATLPEKASEPVSPESPESKSEPPATTAPEMPASEDLTAGLDPNCPRKYQSRDSGFVGSCDDLLNESSSQKEIRKRLSSDSGSSDADGDKSSSKQPHRRPSGHADAVDSTVVKADEADTKSGKSVGSSGSSGEPCGSLTSTSQSSKSGKLSRKDSFNNWSSDEETNLMMNKMRAFFRNMVSTNATKGENENGERVKPPQLVAFENELTRLMKSVPGINDQQVKEIVEYLSSEDTWSDSYDSSDYTSSDLEGAYAVLDPTLPELDLKSDLQQQISASCQEIIEKFDLDRSPEGSRSRMDAAGAIPWLPVGEDASNSLNKETAFVYQRLVNSLMRLNNGPKMPTTETSETTAPTEAAQSHPAASGADGATPHSSPPMIAKVLHHIGNRLVALMHEVSASSDTTSHSGSLDEDAQSAGRMKELRLAAHFEPVTSSPRLTKMGRLFLSKDHHSSADDKRSLSTSADSEDTPTDTEQSPDSDDSRSRDRKKSGDGSGIKYGFESLHTYEKRMSSLPSHLGTSSGSGEARNRGEERESRGFSSLESAEPSRGVIGGSRSLKARLAERARTLEAERRRQQAEEKRLIEEDNNAAEDDAADEDRFFKKERKLPRFSLFRTTRENREALQSSSSGVSDIAEEKEDEFSGWRSSFESAIAADSRTKLSLEAKRRSAGSASSSELFASSELLDRDTRRVRSSGHSSKFSLPNLLERDAVRMAKERERERSASSDVLLSTSPIASNTMLSVIDQQEDEDGGWDRLVITRMSSKRRSSVPDTREERVADREEPRSTTLPRSTTALNAVESDLNLDVLGSSSPSISVSTAGVKKSLSLLLSNSTCNSASESSLNTSVDTPVKSARYRPPGFRPAPVDVNVRDQPRTTPQRAPSAASATGLGTHQHPSVTPRLGTAISGRRSVRSMLADDRKESSSSPSFVREGLRTSVASAASGESFSSVSAADTNDENELATPASKSRSSSLSALGIRSDSMASVYSAAGEARYGTVAVRGEVQFGLHYNYRQTTLEVFVKQCRDLAPVDTKRNRSDPYAKVYLLPDRSRSGKRKTKVKKHTLCPVFEENLKFTTTLAELENRTLWLTVWHSDMFGRNDFLGEITLPLAGRIFDDPTPHWYQLQERSELLDDSSHLPQHRGDIIVALKYVPSDPMSSKKTKKSKGALHVLVKEAKGLVASRPNGNIDALCKGTLLPEKGKTTKHKTIINRRTSNPVWNNTLIFDDVSHQELVDRALELCVWNHDRLASKEFLGGVRFNLGTALYQGKPAEWMDAVGKEVTLWQNVIERAGLWFEGSLPLRTTMEEPVGE